MSMSRKQSPGDYCRKLPPQRRPWDAAEIEAWVVTTILVVFVIVGMIAAFIIRWLLAGVRT